MIAGNKKLTVQKHSPEEEQRLKDEEFLNLGPNERLRINGDLGQGFTIDLTQRTSSD